MNKTFQRERTGRCHRESDFQPSLQAEKSRRCSSRTPRPPPSPCLQLRVEVSDSSTALPALSPEPVYHCRSCWGTFHEIRSTLGPWRDGSVVNNSLAGLRFPTHLLKRLGLLGLQLLLEPPLLCGSSPKPPSEGGWTLLLGGCEDPGGTAGQSWTGCVAWAFLLLRRLRPELA